MPQMKIPPALLGAWANVRDDTSTANWLIVQPNKEGTEASLFAKGKTGWADFCSKFAEDEIFFGGCRARAIDDRGKLKSVRAKFIFVTWIGSKVPAMRRAKGGSLAGQVKDGLFDGTHVSIQATDLDDLNTKELEKQLQSSTGAHKPTGYEFDGNVGYEGLVDKDDDVVESAPAAAPASPSAPTAAPTTPGSPQEVWAQVRDDGSAMNWVNLSYDGKDLKTMTVASKGYGGLDEFKASLAEDQILFGGLRVKAIDDRGTVKSVRSKFIFVSWIGPRVKPVARAQVSTHKDAFEKVLSGCHISVGVSDPSDLNPKDLERTLQSSTGAHKPTGYDFSGSEAAAAAAAKQ